jgi:ion channel POLLUX/CASTOR
LEPAGWYVKVDQDLDMHVLVEAASKRNETAIGYRLKSEESDPDKQFGIYLNPEKSTVFKLSAEDKVIVLAQG